ncbi:MAG: hypothetical protein KatS3mg080_0778 [Anoxybacillus sp.]|nr:MAG: hypothetical protein KatS3mg080_0778 [Anoxybacillus sp.]
MRKIYEYLSIEEKKEAVKRLKRDLIKLEQEISEIKALFQVLYVKYCTVHVINGGWRLRN